MTDSFCSGGLIKMFPSRHAVRTTVSSGSTRLRMLGFENAELNRWGTLTTLTNAGFKVYQRAQIDAEPPSEFPNRSMHADKNL